MKNSFRKREEEDFKNADLLGLSGSSFFKRYVSSIQTKRNGGRHFVS